MTQHRLLSKHFYNNIYIHYKHIYNNGVENTIGRNFLCTRYKGRPLRSGRHDSRYEKTTLDYTVKV